jgi:hypothetical protein
LSFSERKADSIGNSSAAVLSSLLSKNYEFVAANPRNDVRGAESTPENFGTTDQKCVALRKKTGICRCGWPVWQTKDE